MADVVVTASKVSLPYAIEARRRNYLANGPITMGQPVYLLPTGKVDLAGAAAAGKEQFLGIALDTVGAGQTLSVVEIGEVEGFALGAIGTLVYLSNTLGALADAAGTKSVVVGQVRPHNTVGGPIKTLYVSSDPAKVW